MKAPHWLLCCALSVLLCSTGWSRIGETLEECQIRYGSGQNLEVPDQLASSGVQAYEFKRDPYTILVLIGSRQGVMQISYFRKGRFGEAEAKDLMKRNWSGPGEITHLGNPSGRNGQPRSNYSIGVDGDPNSLTVNLTTGALYSELAIMDFMKMVEQSDGPLPIHIEQFVDDFASQLDSRGAEAIGQANEGL